MTIKTDNLQIGVSGRPGNNFVLQADGAGGFKLSRGVVVGGVPVTTQDILTADASGNVDFIRAPWVAATPTPIPLAGGFGAASATLRTRKEGRMVYYAACVDITNIGTASGGVTLALPYAALTTTIGTGLQEWNGAGRESRSVGYVCTSFVKQGTSILNIQIAPGSTLATNNVLNVSGFYESAA